MFMDDYKILLYISCTHLGHWHFCYYVRATYAGKREALQIQGGSSSRGSMSGKQVKGAVEGGTAGAVVGGAAWVSCSCCRNYYRGCCWWYHWGSSWGRCRRSCWSSWRGCPWHHTEEMRTYTVLTMTLFTIYLFSCKEYNLLSIDD